MKLPGCNYLGAVFLGDVFSRGNFQRRGRPVELGEIILVGNFPREDRPEVNISM